MRGIVRDMKNKKKKIARNPLPQRVKAKKVIRRRKRVSEEDASFFSLKEDAFLEDDSKVDANDVFFPHPVEDDLRDELSQLDGFRDYLEEARGYNLSYGDY